MSKIYKKICENCGKEIIFNSASSFYLSIKRGSKCKTCDNSNRKGENNSFYGKKHSEEAKRKIGEANSGRAKTKKEVQTLREKNLGEKNAMYNKTFYGVWLEKYGKEEADKRMILYKEKQRSNSTGNKNPMYGKPSPQRSGNGWKGWYKGTFFRSLRELSFIINVIEKKNYQWESGEKEKFKIEYIDFLGNNRNYFPDFILDKAIIAEVKPKKLLNSPTVILKKEAAEKYAKQNNMVYIIFTEEDYSQLDTPQIDDLINKQLVVFTKKYKEKYIQFKNKIN